MVSLKLDLPKIILKSSIILLHHSVHPPATMIRGRKGVVGILKLRVLKVGQNILNFRGVVL